MTQTVQVCNGTGQPVPVAVVSGGGGSSGGLTDAQLRAAAVPVSAAALPLPAGAAADATLTGGTQQSKLTDGSNTVGVAGSSAAASETSVDRLKVNAALRLLDTAQTAGSQLVAAKGDQTSGLWVNVKNASIAVTGPLTDTQLRASAVPVSLAANQSVNSAQVAGNAVAVGSGVVGTGVQRVVLATDVALPAGTNILGALSANQSVNCAQVSGTAIATGNGVVSAGVQRVAIASDNTAFSVNAVQFGTWNIGSITTLPALVAGSAIIGKVGIDQTTVGTTNGVSLAQVGANTILTGNGVTGNGSPRVTIASDNSALAVTAPTLTKATQSANGFSTQDLKDAGRSNIALTAEFTFAQTAETLLTMTLSQDGAATSTFSSRAVTSGKTFRIQQVILEIESLGSGTAPQRVYLRMRRNNAGATTASSALQYIWSCVNNSAVVKSGQVQDCAIPDGIEIVGDGTKTFGFTLETPDWVTTTATGRAKITIIGYEY